MGTLDLLFMLGEFPNVYAESSHRTHCEPNLTSTKITGRFTNIQYSRLALVVNCTQIWHISFNTHLHYLYCQVYHTAQATVNNLEHF